MLCYVQTGRKVFVSCLNITFYFKKTGFSVEFVVYREPPYSFQLLRLFQVKCDQDILVLIALVLLLEMCIDLCYVQTMCPYIILRNSQSLKVIHIFFFFFVLYHHGEGNTTIS